ncbi:MAG: CDP-alcohol phosphatidyltransferase family protein [Bacilli bacterium]|nr:CDP-alcohol phosphatidyltransferase family protein [Bacilli bacterium]
MSRTKELWIKYYNELKQSIKAFFHGDFKGQFPNMLTFSRMLAPIVIIPLALFRLHNLTIMFTILFAMTDAFDGYLARKWNVVSALGKDLDAFVDKIFAVTLLVAISLIYPILLILVVFEFIIAVINGIETYKDNKPKTIIIGKFKTIALSMLIILFMMNVYFDVPNYILYTIFAITVVLQVFTTLGYLDIYLKNNHNRKIKIVPQESNGKVMTKLNEVLLHEKDHKKSK